MLTALIKAEVELGGQQITPVCMFYCNFTAVCKEACTEPQTLVPFPCLKDSSSNPSVHWSYYLIIISIIN